MTPPDDTPGEVRRGRRTTDFYPVNAGTAILKQWWTVITTVVAAISAIGSVSYQLETYSSRLRIAEGKVADITDTEKTTTTRLDALRDQVRDLAGIRPADADKVARIETSLRSLDITADRNRDDLAALRESLATEHERVGFVLDRLGLPSPPPSSRPGPRR